MKKIILLLFLVFETYANLVVNIGVYQNEPKIFLDNNSKASGFFVDIVDAIAKEENFKLNYVPCNWDECLSLLESGKLDVMPDVAQTNEREERFLFGDETILSSWSVLYISKGLKVESVLDLDNKSIAVLKDSIQSFAIKELLRKFNIKPLYIEVESFQKAFELLAEKQVDSLIVNRFYKFKEQLPKNIIKTDILIEPSTVKFAFSTEQENLRKIFDANIKEMKKNKDSVYYKAKEKWIKPKPAETIPKWLMWSMFAAIAIMSALVFTVVLFKKMLDEKVKILVEKEELLTFQSRHAVMGEMIAMIAHQWRHPLTLIGMSVNNIKLKKAFDEEISDDVIQEHIDTVDLELEYLSKTIDDFRNFFRPNKIKEQIKLSVLLEKFMLLMGNSLKESNIELHIENEKDYELFVYPNELIHIFLNLINNAKESILHNNVKNGKITIKTLKSEGYINIYIIDNGGGIDEKILDSIGTKHFTTKENEGTGLGIYMSKIIVEKYLGGLISWQNLEDGASFKVSIPLFQPEPL